MHKHVELEKSCVMILYWCVCLTTIIDLSLGTSETRRQLKMAMKRGKGKTSITKVCHG